jgi:hypothetical protein
MSGTLPAGCRGRNALSWRRNDGRLPRRSEPISATLRSRSERLVRFPVAGLLLSIMLNSFELPGSPTLKRFLVDPLVDLAVVGFLVEGGDISANAADDSPPQAGIDCCDIEFQPGELMTQSPVDRFRKAVGGVEPEVQITGAAQHDLAVIGIPFCVPVGPVRSVVVEIAD